MTYAVLRIAGEVRALSTLQAMPLQLLWDR